MSFSLFRAGMNALTGMQHVSRMQYSQIIAKSYNSVIENTFETLTGAGKVIAPIAGVPGLTAGIYQITEMNLHQHKAINFIRQMNPYIQTYWASKVIIGPTGVVKILSPGNFMGPIIPQNMDFRIKINIMCAAIAVHLMTLTGMYTNNVTGVTTPWSGALLTPLP